MKKVIGIATVVMALAAASAQAVFYIQWQSTGGFSTTGEAANPLLPNIGDSLTAQLLFAADGVADIEGVAPGGVNLGNDEILATATFSNQTGGTLERYGFFSFVYDEDRAYQAPGSVYVRVFEPGPMEAGSLYAQSGIANATDRNKLGVPPDGPNALNFFASGVNDLNLVVVPEPASLALVLVGAMVAVAANRRRRA